ncbi:la-related protein 7 [Galleria mellonella]|uniref:La-related protein 7 n=1 Tax=Galleria mellonella TaxID=7137 RepID=A0ABM3MTW8_GALME|nr:la-related protein 7 [Galleria mellonella]
MSELEVSKETGDGDNKLDSCPRKRVRHRKKQLYENILKQMEFYFSDANLTKDRFLGELIKTDAYVPVEVFLKFNKIRSMTQDVNDIVKAMKNSTLLELSDDKTKIMRQTPVLPYDADQRTVYVESIPVTASREWLQRVFSDYGHVAYISLPKFKNSQRIKGYGFIEFHKPEDAQKCISTFTKMGCKLPTCMPPEELSSIKMFSVEEPLDAVSSDNKEEKEENEPPKKKSKKNKDRKLHKHFELKLEHESDSEKTLVTPSEENKSISMSTESKSLDEQANESKDELTSQDEGKDENQEVQKKVKKRTAKERSKAKNGSNKNEAPKGALWGLQVLSKSEWKALRNKYLNLQRKYMKEMKANLQNKQHTYSSIPAPAAPSVCAEPDNNTLEERNKNITPFERIPGVFVKEILPEPCLDVRLTKRTIRSNIHAMHVDVKEGQTEVIIRFDSAKAADEYCANSSNARALSGAEEEEQWSRAEGGRGWRRPRGRQRLAARRSSARLAARAAPAPAQPAAPQPTHTHIRFDDE